MKSDKNLLTIFNHSYSSAYSRCYTQRKQPTQV